MLNPVMQKFDPAGPYCATCGNNIHTSVHRGTPNSYLLFYTLNQAVCGEQGGVCDVNKFFSDNRNHTNTCKLCSPRHNFLYNCKKKYRILASNEMTIKDSDRVSNIAVQYVPMCDFW